EVHSRLHAKTGTDLSVLGQELTFRNGRTAQNRFLKAALTERTASWDPKDYKKRGIPNQNIVNLYDKWGHGKFGIILTGNVCVDPIALASRICFLIRLCSQPRDEFLLDSDTSRYERRSLESVYLFQLGLWNLESAGNVVFSKENDCPELRKICLDWASAMKQDGALAIAQISHKGCGKFD
ncbi:unnamed protein product, partial [Strongylus vulgaris]